MLQGYRTIIAGVVGLVVAILTAFGIVIPEDEQAAISLGIAVAVGIFLRYKTTTPIGQKPVPPA